MDDAGYPGLTDSSLTPSEFYSEHIEALGLDFDWNSAEGKKWKELEIETALADFRCGEKVGYIQELYEETFRSQEQFIEEHKAELDALLEESQKKKLPCRCLVGSHRLVGAHCFNKEVVWARREPQSSWSVSATWIQQTRTLTVSLGE